VEDRTVTKATTSICGNSCYLYEHWAYGNYHVVKFNLYIFLSDILQFDILLVKYLHVVLSKNSRI